METPSSHMICVLIATGLVKTPEKKPKEDPPKPAVPRGHGN